MTLRDTRKFMYKQMLALEAGTISIDEALTQSKLVGKVIESYNVEIKAIEFAADIDTTIENYSDGVAKIEE